MSVGANMNAATQKSARCDYNGTRAEPTSLECLNSCEATFVVCEDEPCNGALNRLQVRLLLEQCSDRSSVKTTVTLRARRPDSRAFAAIEHAELDHREVSRLAHNTAKSIDLPNHSAFRYSTDSRIARHLPDCFECAGDETNACAKPSGSDCCLGASVSSADDDYIEIGLKGAN
jgi:hypothetical protein